MESGFRAKAKLLRAKQPPREGSKNPSRPSVSPQPLKERCCRVLEAWARRRRIEGRVFTSRRFSLKSSCCRVAV